MKKIDQKILNINKSICDNIDAFSPDQRWLLSQNILDKLRNLVEHICMKVSANWSDIESNRENIGKWVEYIQSRGSLRFLTKFHYLLQKSISHYTENEENSERLMLKYYEYLLHLKKFMKDVHDFEVLQNIEKFPIKLDPELRIYYEKISEKIKQTLWERSISSYNDRYYIWKIKPFFVAQEIYYEVTFTVASEKVSKFDRIIAFTKLNILPNYAVKLNISNSSIEVFGSHMPIQIIDNRKVSIRPCELNRYADIFWPHTKISTGLIEYNELMKLLTKTWLNLLEVVNFSDNYYDRFKKVVLESAKSHHIFTILDKTREIIKSNKQGSNVVRYLLFHLNNKILKLQYCDEFCKKLSNLKLKWGCIPFDEMPYNTWLIWHNPKISELFECIDPNDRKHEYLARYIRNNTETKGFLYTDMNLDNKFKDHNIKTLTEEYNKRLYYKHDNRRLEEYKWHLFINEYEKDVLFIIKALKKLSVSGLRNYSNSVDARLQSSTHWVDCLEKKKILRMAFENSYVAMIYGSAWTWKTTLINHISNFHKDESKLYLANTNPAVNNLKRRISVSNARCQTIASFLRSSPWSKIDCDLLFVDECSTVSNADMVKILEKASFKLLILVWDIYQIESIRFWNWFTIAQSFIPKTSVFELIKPYRSNNEKLLMLWNKVRNIDDSILEHITKNDYSISLNNSIFTKEEWDEIILCLNYDWLYGINNINKFLQENNPNPPIQRWVHRYKIGDPILFNDSDRFRPLLYNNLKWTIIDIKVFDQKIQFDVEIDKTINELATLAYDLELLDQTESDRSLIRFFVNKLKSTDEDDDSWDSNVPFQVAYAVSMHKAQGLEYDSVKVVITDEIWEMITHSIFYTAITRAKVKLKIYWSPETESKVLSNLESKFNQKDIQLLKHKFNL